MSVCSKLKGPCPCSRSFGLSLRVDMPEKKRVKFTDLVQEWDEQVFYHIDTLLKEKMDFVSSVESQI